MAHFAKIENNTVVQVEVVHNDIVTDEQAGITFLQNLYNNTATWKQTSYNTYHNTHKLGGIPFRGNFAGINFIWDSDNNIFLPPKPFASWTKDISSASWDETAYQSDNSTGWVLLNIKP